MPKLKASQIATTVRSTGQGHVFQCILITDHYRYRVEVTVDSYDQQTHRQIDVWSDQACAWNVVLRETGFAALRCYKAVDALRRDKVTPEHFADDRVELFAIATQVVEE